MDVSVSNNESSSDLNTAKKKQIVKNLTSTIRYTPVGQSQLIQHMKRTIPSSSSSTKKRNRTKFSQTFVVRKIGKDCKSYKATNMSYMIKPVCKDIGHIVEYPLLYTGAPLLTNPGDFEEIPKRVNEHKGTNEMTGNVFTQLDTRQSKQGAEKLYDISSLEKIFLPSSTTTSEECPNSKTLFKREGGGVSGNIISVSMNNLAAYQKPTHCANSLFTSNNAFQMVVRTVPSATNGNTFSYPKIKVLNPDITERSDTKQLSVSECTTAQKVYSSHPNCNTLSSNSTPDSSMNQVSDTTNVFTAVKVPIMSLRVLRESTTGELSNHVPPSQITSLHAMKVNETIHDKSTVPMKLILPKVGANENVECAASSKPDCAKKLTQNLSSETELSLKGHFNQSVTDNNDTGHPLGNQQCTSSQLLSCDGPSARKEKMLSCSTNALSCRLNGNHKQKPVEENVTPCLRIGVEVMFDDGVKDFISNLKHMTYVDDEPIKSWMHLKKGIKVAAQWKDGLFYDAIVVGCYIPSNMQMQPVVKLEKLTSISPQEEHDFKSSSRMKKGNSETVTSKIICSACKMIFKRIPAFRKHQKFKCKAEGRTVATENCSISVVTGDERKNGLKAKITNSYQEADAIAKSRKNSKQTKVKQRENGQSKLSSKTLVTLPNSKNELSELLNPCRQNLFHEGTKFKHRWQLEDGTSRWYTGEVKKVISEEKGTDCEFEVLYQEEEDQGPYILKLYEDYPADIRIVDQK